LVKHDLTSEIVDDIVGIMVLRVNEVVEKMRGVPGMEEQETRRDAARTARQGLMSGDQDFAKAMIDRVGGVVEVARLLEEEENV